MARFDFDLGVIGGGAAGLTVTAGAARLGVKTLLIEREPALGGDCLHSGCVPSKTLIRTAQIYHAMKNAGRYGLPAISPPPVDFRQVAERIRAVIATIQQHDSAERFRGLGAQVVFGEPCFADEHTVALGGRRFTAARWVIATGSSPMVPEIPGLDRVPFLTNRELFRLNELPASLVILGCGPVAIEMAQAFARLGSRVQVIQRSGQILSKEDKDLADLAMTALQGEGVTFRLNSTVTRVNDLGHEQEVLFRTAQGREERLRAGAILVAMGRRANVEGLGLAGLDIAASPTGIVVDQRLRTSRKHIFAAGDVLGRHQFTHAAGYEGSVVLSNAVFRLPRKVDYTWLPWCTYMEPELASIGLNEKRARAAGLDYTVWREEFAANDRALAEGEERGVIKLLTSRNGKPVGVQIFGPHAGELLGTWVAALNGQIKLATLAAAIHPYPTVGEISKQVAGKVLAAKLFSPKVQKALSLLFRYQGRACGAHELKIENAE
ncbi:MAG: FAD-dependent oxidoreductase [Thermodesulfobacteriota bacterium]